MNQPLSAAEEAARQKRRIDPRLVARLLGYLKPYWGWVAFTFLLIIIASGVRQAGPYLTKIAVDDHIAVGDADGLTGLILIYLGLLLVQFVIGYGESWATNMVGQWAMRDVRIAMFRRLQRLPLKFFDRTPIGRLMARNTNDVDALNEMFTDGLVSVCSDIFTIVTILGFILWMDVRLGLVTGAALPLAFIATMWLQNKTNDKFREARVRFDRFSASLQETISGAEVIKLFGCEDARAKDFTDANDRYLDSRLQTTFYHSLFFPFMEFGGVTLMALVLWYGGGRVLGGTVEWGVLVAMLQYVPRFFMPMRDIAERFHTIQVAMASSERIFELLDTPVESGGGDIRPDRLRGEIEFRNVWFAYDEEEWVLRDVSFKVEPGQRVALVGATGAGKSTIVNLVCRFYDIQKGTILVDGVDIREWDVEVLRRHVGLVQQDVFLFSGDIQSNINLGDEEIGRAAVRQAAHAVNADRFINALPDGYDHEVQERGVCFSGGQRQLLSFARALAADPEILVLDEATASIDTETEMWIQEAVEELTRNRTSIVIAHRLSTIRKTDTIIVLHHGEVREQGNHDALLKQDGLYSRLHQLQYKDTG
jgi:ATP-binding cassette, subfamily B, multidrug efflux pump